LILIEIAWYFADLRTPSSSLARPQDIGPAGPPVFAENLQALTIPFAITTRRSQYRRIASSISRGASMQITTKMRNCQLENGSKVKMPAMGILPRAWLPRNIPLSCGIMELSHSYSKI
jgi:hypothetical protein